MTELPSPMIAALDLKPGFWIDGGWVLGAAEGTPVINPATGEAILSVPLAGSDDFARAIDGAHRSFGPWSRTPNSARGEVLKRGAALLAQRRNELARLLTAEQGKPLAQSLAEVDYAISFFQWFGEEARRLSGRIQSHPTPGYEYLVKPVALGIAALITPWNFPLAQGAKKLAAALAAGCAVVWKPSELTPLIAMAMGPLFREAGLPPGVLQILPALGQTAADAFAADPRIRVISVTGSTATGQSVVRASARHLPRLSLELGGNAPFIVLPGADLDQAAQDLVRLKSLCSGQVCVTANRVFIPAASEDRFVELVAAHWRKLRLGNGSLAGTDLGPLIHRRACDRVKQLVEAAVAAGASVEYEDESLFRDPSLGTGSFFAPTLLRGVRDEMAIAREEIFGPVTSLLSYEHVDEAVTRANATHYGLAAYVYGRDTAMARAVADALEAGIVGINEWRPLRAEIPFGGSKMSGQGHEGGEEGLREFSGIKVISVPTPILGCPAQA